MAKFIGFFEHNCLFINHSPFSKKLLGKINKQLYGCPFTYEYYPRETYAP